LQFTILLDKSFLRYFCQYSLFWLVSNRCCTYKRE